MSNDESPRECECYYSIIKESYGEIYVEKSAYLAVKQELDSLQLRLEKCEGLLAESKGYLIGYTDAGKPLALEIDEYFAEVEK